MSIETITTQENNLLKVIRQYKGNMESIMNNMHKDGIFEEYAIIHQKYISLYEDEINIEALKRAIFVQWYSLSEPSCFTGIKELNEDIEKQALNILKNLLEKNLLDSEFISMIVHYSRIMDLPFQELKVIIDNIPKQDPLQELSNNIFNDRGQLGDYWKSIIE